MKPNCSYKWTWFLPTTNLYCRYQAIKIRFDWTPLITYKKDGKTKESHATTRRISLSYIHKYYYNQSIDDGFFTLRLMREDIETSYKDNHRSINEEIQRRPVQGRYLAHPHYRAYVGLYHCQTLSKCDLGLWWPDHRWHDCLWLRLSSPWAWKQLGRASSGWINKAGPLLLSFTMRETRTRRRTRWTLHKKARLTVIAHSMLRQVWCTWLKRLTLGRRSRLTNLG